MRAGMMLNIQNLIDEGKCFETVRQMRWPDGVICPRCTSPQVTQQGYDETQPARRKDECSACRRRFDDRTGTICAGHHRPWRTWILCLDLMGLKLANTQRAQELDLRGYPVTFPCNSRYLKGTGFLDVLGFKSRSIR